MSLLVFASSLQIPMGVCTTANGLVLARGGGEGGDAIQVRVEGYLPTPQQLSLKQKEWDTVKFDAIVDNKSEGLKNQICRCVITNHDLSYVYQVCSTPNEN